MSLSKRYLSWFTLSVRIMERVKGEKRTRDWLLGLLGGKNGFGNSSSGTKKYQGSNSSDGGNTGDEVKIADEVIGSGDEIGNSRSDIGLDRLSRGKGNLPRSSIRTNIMRLATPSMGIPMGAVTPNRSIHNIRVHSQCKRGHVRGIEDDEERLLDELNELETSFDVLDTPCDAAAK
ncbi:hypothetical protein Tco_1121134 [Tanacetum coccineum]|uniref:Uncharacterized protein n=1 Tax=Tanacetum coccineum TaxID=301880 RepID=A0ABQ5IWU7_9ASTR